MSSKNICKHKDVCPIFQGKTDVKEKQLTVYKNVFCNRGYRGWRNCNQFLIFENQGRRPNENE